MQTGIIIFIITLCVLYWVNRFFPNFRNLLWKGNVVLLQTVHAPMPIQKWALKHYVNPKAGGSGACNKCSSKCH